MRPCPHPVADLLPHAAPMILLDEVLGWDQGRIKTAVTISPKSPFFTEGHGVPSYVGLEYMAQSCGVYAGIEGLNHGRPVKVGFLLGTRNYHAAAGWFRTGERLIIEGEETYRQDGMAVFDCRISLNDNALASAQLSLYQPTDASDAFMKLSGD